MTEATDLTILRNLTPHDVVIRIPDAADASLHPESTPARCRLSRTVTGSVRTGFGEIPLTRTHLVADVSGLPDPEPGTLLIVARDVVLARPDRADLVFPDDIVRDDAGRVVACRALGRAP